MCEPWIKIFYKVPFLHPRFKDRLRRKNLGFRRYENLEQEEEVERCTGANIMMEMQNSDMQGNGGEGGNTNQAMEAK